MNREIKFRAWDKLHNCFLILDYGRLDCRTEQHLLFNGKIVYKTYNSKGLQFDSSENIVLMQFTGLYDKNGKEIYEGDIVKNYAFIDKVIIEKGFVTTSRSIEDKFKCKQPLVVHIELEVIGNIYQNPELLKGDEE